MLKVSPLHRVETEHNRSHSAARVTRLQCWGKDEKESCGLFSLWKFSVYHQHTHDLSHSRMCDSVVQFSGHTTKGWKWEVQVSALLWVLVAACGLCAACCRKWGRVVWAWGRQEGWKGRYPWSEEPLCGLAGCLLEASVPGAAQGWTTFLWNTFNVNPGSSILWY